MIDEAKSPECARISKKHAKVFREWPAGRELIEQLARIEENALDVVAKATLSVNLVGALERLVPEEIDRQMLTPVDMRAKLTAIRAEVSAARHLLTDIG